MAVATQTSPAMPSSTHLELRLGISGEEVHTFQRKGSSLSLDSADLGTLINDMVCESQSNVDNSASTIPRLQRIPSGNSFATMPRGIEPSELSRVASGLSHLSVTLSQMDEIQEASESERNPPRAQEQTPVNDTHSSRYLYDVSVLDRCLSRDVETLPEAASVDVTNVQAFTASIGPFGPYNPAPSWIQAPSHVIPPAEPKELDIFEGKQVIMVRGKYKGKSAFVQRKVNKKYRLQVEGVSWGLEFYPNMFTLPTGGRL